MLVRLCFGGATAAEVRGRAAWRLEIGEVCYSREKEFAILNFSGRRSVDGKAVFLSFKAEEKDVL